MKRLLIVVLGVFLTPGNAPCHLCDNIWRLADRLIIKAEVSNLVIDKEASFKVYVQNNMGRSISKEVILVGTSEAFNVEVYPLEGHRLIQGKQYEYTVKLKLKPRYKSGNYPLEFNATVGGRTLRTYSMKTSLVDNMLWRNQNKIPIIAGEHPLIDGKMTEVCWRNALSLQTLLNTENQKPKMPSATFFVCCGDNIYVAMAVREIERNNKHVKQSETDRDKKDINDSQMVMFSPSGQKEIYGFRVSYSGKIEVLNFADGKEKKLDAAASGVKVSVIKSNKVWYAEVCIPAAVFNLKNGLEGKSFRTNIVRVYGDTLWETSFWSGTPENYMEPEAFGEVVILR